MKRLEMDLMPATEIWRCRDSSTGKVSWTLKKSPSDLPSHKRLQKTMERSTMLFMGKLTISMAIFNVSLPVT